MKPEATVATTATDISSTTTTTQELTVEELKKQLEHEREIKNTWLAKATDAEKRFAGIDPERVKADREALEALQREKALSDPKELAAWKGKTETELRQSVDKDIKAALARAEKAERENKELKVTTKVFSVGANLIEKCVHDDFKEYIRRYCDEDEHGEIIIKDDNGKMRYAPGSTTERMTPAQLIDTLKEQKPVWFTPSTMSGTGAGGGDKGGAGGGASNPWERMSKEQILNLAPEQVDKIPQAILRAKFL